MSVASRVVEVSQHDPSLKSFPDQSNDKGAENASVNNASRSTMNPNNQNQQPNASGICAHEAQKQPYNDTSQQNSRVANPAQSPQTINNGANSSQRHPQQPQPQQSNPFSNASLPNQHPNHHQQQPQSYPQSKPVGQQAAAQPTSQQPRPPRPFVAFQPGPDGISLAPLTGLPPRAVFPTDRFQKIRTIRRTLFGKVVLYVDRDLNNRAVAIKLSDKKLLANGTTTSGNRVAENPLEEIRIMNILSGQLIKSQCPIYNIPAEIRYGSRYVLTSLGEYEDAEFLYTVMPFCGKGEFFDLVCSETRFSEKKAKFYFLQMIQGVRYMHALGMAHLDLSLENLLMTDSNELKVCDYGVTRHMSFNEQLQLVSFPATLNNKPGKLGYMSKEIFGSQPFSGTASDVWSMGVILFISLFGVPPYQVPALSDQRFALIVTGQIRRLLAAWKMSDVASDDAVSLISDMLCDEDKRLNIEQILMHPWLRELVDGNPMFPNINQQKQLLAQQALNSTSNQSVEPALEDGRIKEQARNQAILEHQQVVPRAMETS